MESAEGSAAPEVELRASVEGYSQRRIDLVRRAVQAWVKALFDLGGRNNLLRYRDLKLGTVDLTDADPAAITWLLRGRSVRSRALQPGTAPEDRIALGRRFRAIYRKAKENFEERGVATLHVGFGLATWESKTDWEPAAPVLLRRAELRPLGAAQDDFELTLVDEVEVNPVFLHLLRADFGLSIQPEALLAQVDGVVDEPWELEQAYRWITEQAKAVPRFAVERRLVLANFSYAKLPMVRDLEAHIEELLAHDLIAAIAGDEEALEAVRAATPPEDLVLLPDHIPPADEYLVLDADASQHFAINSVIAGESLIVKGPPGTGKSQTIGNLICALVARGQKVLFVAEKRAAIDAVLKRLHHHRLGDLVLDLHGGVGSRRAVAQTIARSLSGSRSALPVDRSAQQRALQRMRDELNAYEEALHRPRQPWEISLYEARAEAAGVPEPSRTGVRIRGEALQRFDARAYEHAREDLVDLVRIGGLGLSTSGSPWAAAPITTEDEVRQAYDLVDELRRHGVPTALQRLRAAAAETGLPVAPSFDGWGGHVDLWEAAARTLARCTPEVYGLDLDALTADLAGATRGWLSRAFRRLFSGRYRAARRTLRAVAREPVPRDRALHEAATDALRQREAWRRLGAAGAPAPPSDLDPIRRSFDQAAGGLETLGGTIAAHDLGSRPTADVESLLDALAADQATLVKLPEVHRLERALEGASLSELLADLAARRAPEDLAVAALRFAWLRSIVEEVTLADQALARFSPERQDRTAEEFRASDPEHLDSNAARIRRLSAERLIHARETHTEQDRTLLAYAGKKQRHEPVARLVESATDVLLALKPCWAMSPLVVSQLLPARPLFDVVVFDEASQITPADAITSILRGRQLVVAGDERQLPPTAFFASETAEDLLDEEEEQGLLPPRTQVTDFQSILDALKPLLPRWKTLEWHYRSQDERLIAFSNANFYDRSLITFPGVGGDACIRFVQAPWEPGADTNSPSPEVEQVVELVLDHARDRPDESLGVIAMGIKHATRIEEALRLRLVDRPELEGFFSETREERFFVKNLERVQGDERDAIILSIGYGKDRRGRLVYRFGPLLAQGGERRLNVAVTRAKKRLTLVASFSSRDMDPEKLGATGMQLVRRYVQYAESGGDDLGGDVMDKPALDPFEMDVRDTLGQHLSLVPQHGASGYWIDFAVRHPTQSGRFVLAIECDGAMYHSARSARERDRLRQDHLERLGWRFHRIWSTEWFSDRDAAIRKALAACRLAFAEADGSAPEGQPQPGDPHPVDGPAEPVVAPPVRGPIPYVVPGLPIADHPESTLARLADWVESDGVPRTEGEVLADMMAVLGYRRRGSRIVDRLTNVIRSARRRRAGQRDPGT